MHDENGSVMSDKNAAGLLMLTMAQFILKIMVIIPPFARRHIERLFDDDSVDFG